MTILIAEQDLRVRRSLKASLARWGHDVVACSGNVEAWEILSGEAAPPLAIIGHLGEAMDGLDLCRKARLRSSHPYLYLILLTRIRKSEDVIDGLDAGADDVISRAYSAEELKSRLRAGKRILDLQMELMADRDDLEGSERRAA